MPLDFSIIIHVRQQFGNEDLDIGVFAGAEKEFDFDCPSVNSSAHALLIFQSLLVDKEQLVEVNGSKVFGGIPAGSLVTGTTAGIPLPLTVDNHSHIVLAKLQGWSGNTMIVNENVLRETGNTLKISATDDNFVVDNVIILYKVRHQGPVVSDVIGP